MSLLYVLLLLATLGCATHLWMVPFVRTRWQAGDLRDKVARAAALTIVEKVRELCAIGILTISPLLTAVWILSFFHERRFIIPEGAIDFLSLLHSVTTNTVVGYRGFLIAFGALVLGLLLLRAGRGAKRKVAAAWMTRTQEIQKRIVAHPEELDALRDDPLLRDPIALLDESVRRAGTADLTNEQVETLRRRMQHTLTYVALELASRELDVETALRGDPHQGAPDRKRPQRLLRIFTSAQLSRDLGLLNRRLSRVATAVLLVSLTGWAATPLANSLQLTVNNLRMHSLEEDVDRTLNEAISHATSESDADSPEVDMGRVSRASRLLARATLRQLQSSGVLDRSAGLSPPTRARSEFVRAAILERTPPTLEVGAATDIRVQVARQVASGNSTEGAADEALEQIDKQVRPVVETIQRRDPRLVNRLLSRLEARYGATATPVDVGGQLISNMVTATVDSLRPPPANEVVKQAQDLVRDVGKSAVATWTDTYAKAIAAESLSGDATLDDLRAVQFRMSRESSSFVRQLDAAREIDWLPSASEEAREQLSRRLADIVGRRGNAGVSVARNLGGYSSLFARAPEVVGYADDAGRAGVRVGALLGRKASSMSFAAASRSFRVRGVLFGRDLEGDELLVDDIAWDIDEKADEGFAVLSLSVRSDGTWRPVGRFPAGIVNQSLRYAADQRVVAATIVPGDGSVLWRVTYLHPALADTPLGCRVVEADRFVDNFAADENSADRRLRAIAKRRDEIRDFQQIAQVAELIAENCVGCSLSDVEEAFAEVLGQRRLASAELRRELEEFFAGELGQAPSGTAFVERTLACATAGAGADVLKCLAVEFGDYRLPRTYWFPEDHTSQLREEEAWLDGKFEWLDRSEDRFGHLELWLHTTFALRGRGGGPMEEVSVALDFPEELIEALNDIVVGELIPQYLEASLHSPSYDDFMGPLEDFVVLQRLMRAAMNGQLGGEFPLGELVDLERDTRRYVPFQPTVRWEPMDDAREAFWDILRETGPDAERLYRGALEDQIAWQSGRRRCLGASR